MTCPACKSELFRCGLCHDWRCWCVSGVNVPVHYDAQMQPYPVMEKAARQLVLGTGWCTECEEAYSSSTHRQHVATEREGQRQEMQESLT